MREMRLAKGLKIFFMISGITNLAVYAFFTMSEICPTLYYYPPQLTYTFLYADLAALIYLYKDNRYVIYLLIAHSAFVAIYSAMLFTGIIQWQDSFWDHTYEKLGSLGVVPTVLIGVPIVSLLKLRGPQGAGLETILSLATIILLALYLKYMGGE